tara:strand:+ start:238 stop:765 length:528 start_codon:yes stop_codon:yes gene_type:complete
MIVETKILKELSKIASPKKDGNPRISMIRLDGKDGKARLWATDGHCMVSVLLDAPAPPEAVSYDLDMIKKLTKNDRVTLEGSTLKDDRGGLPVCEDQNAPDIDQVIPKTTDTNGPEFVGVNPNLLGKVMGVVGKIRAEILDCEVGGRMQLGADELAPIRYDLGPITAVIMPIRLR